MTQGNTDEPMPGMNVGGASFAGNVVTFPDDGDRWKVYDRDARKNVCLSHVDGLSCPVSSGNYSVINVSTNSRTLLVIP